MRNANIESFFDERTNTVTYVVSDPQTNKCAIIDSVLDYDANTGRTSTNSADVIIDYININALKTEWILETHAHADHLSAAPYLKSILGGKVAIGDHIASIQRIFSGVFNAESSFKADGSQFDYLFKEDETFKIGRLNVKIIYTPGHTPACVSYYVGDAVFVGDTLFMPDYGSARCDFPGGDATMLYQSVQKIFQLAEGTRMFLCHDYKAEGRDKSRWETTVGEQKRHNIHLHEGVIQNEFVKMRTERDKTLSMPKLILPSIQVNMRAGHMPPPEDNGISYLKIPINEF